MCDAILFSYKYTSYIGLIRYRVILVETRPITCRHAIRQKRRHLLSHSFLSKSKLMRGSAHFWKPSLIDRLPRRLQHYSEAKRSSKPLFALHLNPKRNQRHGIFFPAAAVLQPSKCFFSRLITTLYCS